MCLQDPVFFYPVFLVFVCVCVCYDYSLDEKTDTEMAEHESTTKTELYVTAFIDLI